jgi:hypothetical protein
VSIKGAGYQEHTNYRLWQNAKARARKYGVPFTISPDDVVVPSHCPLLGVEIKVSPGRFSPSSPSLDRIVPDKGYVPGNVMVISFRANTIKSDAEPDEVVSHSE